MDNNLLKTEIAKVLQKTHAEKHKSQREWTAAFIEALNNLGKKEYSVYPNKENSGWLLNLSWAREGNDWRIDFNGLQLACEIEWSRNIDDILYDFQKLTVIDSDIRLMIFQYNNDDEFNSIFTAIKKASNYTKPKGYKYLIAGSGNQSEKIKIFEI